MKTQADDTVAEVRAARKLPCDRFGNDPRRLLAHPRANPRNHRGRIIKSHSELERATALHKVIGREYTNDHAPHAINNTGSTQTRRNFLNRLNFAD